MVHDGSYVENRTFVKLINLMMYVGDLLKS